MIEPKLTPNFKIYNLTIKPKLIDIHVNPSQFQALIDVATEVAELEPYFVFREFISALAEHFSQDSCITLPLNSPTI